MIRKDDFPLWEVHIKKKKKPCFGDHELVMVQLRLVRPPLRTSTNRNWCKYSKEKLCEYLAMVDWSNEATTVQDVWNDFEVKLINVVDSVLPISEMVNNLVPHNPSKFVKRKQNLRKRLLKNFKRNPSADLKNWINSLNFEIKTYFYAEKRNNVRRNIRAGNSKSLWKAVKAANVTSMQLHYTNSIGVLLTQLNLQLLIGTLYLQRDKQISLPPKKIRGE